MFNVNLETGKRREKNKGGGGGEVTVIKTGLEITDCTDSHGYALCDGCDECPVIHLRPTSPYGCAHLQALFSSPARLDKILKIMSKVDFVDTGDLH